MQSSPHDRIAKKLTFVLGRTSRKLEGWKFQAVVERELEKANSVLDQWDRHQSASQKDTKRSRLGTI
jgi:hypothetical protein